MGPAYKRRENIAHTPSFWDPPQAPPTQPQRNAEILERVSGAEMAKLIKAKPRPFLDWVAVFAALVLLASSGLMIVLALR